MVIVMFALSVTVYEIFSNAMCLTFTLTFRMNGPRWNVEEANWKPKHDFLFDANSNGWPLTSRSNLTNITVCLCYTVTERRSVSFGVYLHDRVHCQIPPSNVSQTVWSLTFIFKVTFQKCRCFCNFFVTAVFTNIGFGVSLQVEKRLEAVAL